MDGSSSEAGEPKRVTVVTQLPVRKLPQLCGPGLCIGQNRPSHAHVVTKPTSQCLANNRRLCLLGVEEGSAPRGHSGTRALEFLVEGRQQEGPSLALPHMSFGMTHEPLIAPPAEQAPGLHLSVTELGPVQEFGGAAPLMPQIASQGMADKNVPGHASSPAFLPSTHRHKHRISDPQGIRPR